VGLDQQALYLQVPPEIQHWVSRRFGSTLSRAAAAACPPLRRVELIASDDVEDVAFSGQVTQGVPAPPLHHVTLKRDHTFAHFVIGNSNRFAHAAALTAAEMPGHAYNPLFIHGPSGVGKTHLLQAIADYTIAHAHRLSVHYTTVENFTSHFMTALQRNEVQAFKDRYRRSDVLLLDDVQFLEGKEKTSEEFFYTVDALLGGGGQIALSGDRHPCEMPLLQARLRERLQEGLIVDLHQPDLSTRLAILRVRANAGDIQVDSLEVLEHIARRIESNIRVLEGALIRVAAFASLTEHKLTVELADQVLGDLYREGRDTPSASAAKPTITSIQQATSAALHIDAQDLCSPGRSRHVVYARQVAMYLCRELTDLSLPAIGRQFGGRDHTTVLHAHRKVQNQIATDRRTSSLVLSLKHAISSPPTSPHVLHTA
jgi:chromosomal replication initiator protein